jgi:hypothetical protein
MTPEYIRYQISQMDPLLELARDHYYQMVLVLGKTWQERTLFLKELAGHKGYAYIAFGLPLSRSLLERSLRDRPMVLSDLISTLLASHSEEGIVVDQIEILFDPALHTDPLQLLQMYARSRLLVLSWPGQYEHNRLTFAEPGHPEYYAQTVHGLLNFSLEVNE